MLIVMVVVVAAGVLGGLLIWVLYRRQTPPELRGNWWPAFEEAFWEYESGRRTSVPGRRQPDARRSGGG